VTDHESKPPRKEIKIGRYSIKLPASRALRIALGAALVVCGIVGFLPVLGFWMIPLGLFVLSIDIPIVGRWRNKLQDWWERRNKDK
jgi:hypothetical protein